MATPQTKGFSLQGIPAGPSIPKNIGQIDARLVYDGIKKGLDTFEAVRRAPASMALADATLASETAQQPLAARAALAQTEGIEQQTPLNTAILASRADPAVLEAQRKVAINEADPAVLNARLRHLLLQATPAAVREIEILTAGMKPEDKQRAIRVALGIEARPSSAAITYQKFTGPDGREYFTALDPRAVGAQVIGTGETYGSGVARPGQAPIPAISQPSPTQTPPAAPNAVISPTLAQEAVVVAPAASPFVSPAPGQIKSQEVTAAKTAEQIAEARAKLPQARISLEGLEAATKRVEEDLDRAISLVSGTTTGAVGEVARRLPIVGPATSAGSLEGLLNTIRANVGFDTLLQMRLSSPTGGALGNVSDYEGKQLQAAIADLTQARDPEEVRRALERVKQVRQEAVRRTRAQYEREVRDYGFPVGDSATLGTDVRPPAAPPITVTPQPQASPKFQIVEIRETATP
jgi:hypothetical protein